MSQLSLAMSQIISPDAPLLSPTDDYSPIQHDFPYYTLPPSPPNSDGSPVLHPSSILRIRSLQDHFNADPELCLPPHQVFDFPEILSTSSLPPPPPTPPSRSPSLSLDILARASAPSAPSPTTIKRTASPAPSTTKKRAVGERISSKDFIPPDVSGLSKREARLVKNRAAAFLSRQRKREEFECMEVRVAELEQENARLLALTQNQTQSGTSISALHNSHSHQKSPSDLASQIEQLKAQLALSEQRERSLSAQLAKSSSHPVKLEASDTQFASLLSSSSSPSSTVATSSRPSTASSSTSSIVSSNHKASASLGLMVLLCALPTILSMRAAGTTGTPNTSFSIPNPFPSSSQHGAYDYNSFLPADYEWARMDVDVDKNIKQKTRIRKLEFASDEPRTKNGNDTDIDSDPDVDMDLCRLNDLDISFDASEEDQGKIRVRIHPASPPSREGSISPSLSSSSSWSLSQSSSSYDSASLSYPSSSSHQFPLLPNSIADPDPFLGVSSPNSFSYLAHSSTLMSQSSQSQHSFNSHETDFGLGSYGLENLGFGGSLDGVTMSLDSGMLSPKFSSSSQSLLTGWGTGTNPAWADASASSASQNLGESGAKKRVRIALKSMPREGGEGGEWEVSLC